MSIEIRAAREDERPAVIAVVRDEEESATGLAARRQRSAARLQWCIPVTSARSKG